MAGKPIRYEWKVAHSRLNELEEDLNFYSAQDWEVFEILNDFSIVLRRRVSRLNGEKNGRTYQTLRNR